MAINEREYIEEFTSRMKAKVRDLRSYKRLLIPYLRLGSEDSKKVEIVRDLEEEINRLEKKVEAFIDLFGLGQ
ncbi:MAG: hypothetical protein ACTSPB_09065 [Candidatus Thorarchaeota archaeon]